MSLGGETYRVLYVDQSEPVEVKTRTTHWLKMERAMRAKGGTQGTLESVLRVIHLACGSDLSFEDWVETLDDWEKVAEVDVDPPEPSPATSPS